MQISDWENGREVILETAACLGTVRLCGVDMKSYIEAKETCNKTKENLMLLFMVDMLAHLSWNANSSK